MPEDAKPELPAAEPRRALPPGPSASEAPAPPGVADTGPLLPFPEAHPPGLAPSPVGSTLRPIVTLTDERFAWSNGVRAALGVGLPFALVTATAGVEHGATAAIGGYAVLYASREPYRRRARVLAAVGLGLAAAYTAGALVAGHRWFTALVIAVVAAAATFLCGALRVGRPGGYIFTLVCALGTFVPPDLGLLPTNLGWLLVGCAGGWLVSMSGWLFRPHHPEHVVTADAFRAVAGFLDAIGSPQVDAARHRASHGVYQAWVTLTGAADRHARMSGEARRLQVLVRRAHDVFHAGELLAEERSKPLPPEIGDVVRGLADAVGRPALVPLPEFLAGPETNGQRRLRTALRDAVRAAAEPTLGKGEALKGERPGALELLETAAGRASLLPPVAIRTGLAVGAATGDAEILPIVHPSWVAIGAAAALQGGNAVLDLGSALQRAIGTAIGVFVVTVFLHDLSPGPWETVVAVALLYGAAQTVIRRNLVAGTAFITPVPLLLVGAGVPGSEVGDLAFTRLLDMLLGLAIGLFISFFLWRRASTARLPAALGRAIRAEGLLLRSVVAGRAEEDAAGWLRTRTAARRELIQLWNVYESSLGELAGRRVGVQRLWPAVVVAQRLGFRLMAAPFKPAPALAEPPPPEELDELAAYVQELAEELEKLDAYIQELASAAEDRRTPAPPELPEMWGHPVLRQHLKRLTRALGEAAEPVAPSLATQFLSHLSEPPRRVREADQPGAGQLR
ncbi:FUSC family protein [Yinghuangia soli]|uniref:FUSC family protein n=1 Tax=Yinghuangia soli TaxID=2908204 RepID=A0AA41U0P6_9ACTN|nr:FUSC family protein [Yinghuangia soli]MCF2530023.1 FUSC family protein [Yinghuangia soli]